MHPDHHENVDFDVYEHGRRWAVCLICGAQWEIVDTSRGEDYEQVSDGDGYCEDRVK